MAKPQYWTKIAQLFPKDEPKGKKIKALQNKEYKGIVLKLLFILLAGLFIYAPVFHGDWIWDDEALIRDNKILANPNALVGIWTTPNGPDYFPLQVTTQWLFYQWNGLNTTGWHLLSITLHLLNALLVWKVLQRLKIPGAWVGGLLFCVHPILVESVAWVSELKNTLSMPFLLLSLLAWINFEEKRQNLYYLLAVILFSASMLCKTSVVMYPFVILLYCWWKHGSISLSNFLRSWAFFLVSLILGIITVHFQFSRSIGNEALPVNGIIERIAITGNAVFFYLYKIIIPFGYLPTYPQWDVSSPSWTAFLAWPTIAVLCLWFWCKRNTWGKHAIFGFGSFLLMAFPVLGFVNMSYMRISWVADHFIYVPILGIIGLTASIIGTIYTLTIKPNSKQTLQWLGAALLTLLIFQSYRYASIFVNEYTLWTYTVAHNPESWQAQSRLGRWLLHNKELDKALPHIRKAVKLRPDLAETHNNLGEILALKGENVEALEALRLAAKLEPAQITFQKNLGIMLLNSKKYKEAESLFASILYLRPNNPSFLSNMGVALYGQGKKEEAIKYFKHALAVDPNFKDAKDNLSKISK